MRVLLGFLLLSMVLSCKSSGRDFGSREVEPASSTPVTENKAPITSTNPSDEQLAKSKDALEKQREAQDLERRIWEARNALEASSAKSAEEKAKAEVALKQAQEQLRVLLERERLDALAEASREQNSPKQPDPLPISVIIKYYSGRVLDGFSGSYELKSRTQVFTEIQLASQVKQPLTCDLKKISDTVYSCDYSSPRTNCVRSCWNARFGEGNKAGETCTECRTPYLDIRGERFDGFK